MKNSRNGWSAFCGVAVLSACSSASPDEEPAPESTQPPAELAASTDESVGADGLTEQERAENALLQAAFDARYTRAEQEALVAAAEREQVVDFAGTLSEAEKRAVLAQLAVNGVPSEEVEFVGRMVSLGDDAYFHVEALLADEPETALVDKGFVLEQTTGGVTSPYAGVLVHPDQYAFDFGGTFHFWRPAVAYEDYPNVLRRYYLVVPNDIPAKVKGALEDAVDTIEGANSNDCIINNTFRILTESQWNALSTGNQMYHYKVTVRYSNAWPQNTTNPSCGSLGAYACAVFPRIISRSFASADKQSSAARMSFGSYLGINKIIFSGSVFTREKIHWFLAHELGHLIGLSHPFPPTGGPDPLHVPGTSTNPNECDSMMDYNNSGNGTDGCQITSDDRLTIRKLYPTNGPVGCDYQNSVMIIQ